MKRLAPLLLCAAACSSPSETYVLVHGAFQDASAWDAVAPLLEADGHAVQTVELLGRNGDDTPHADISLDDHVAAIDAVVDGVDGPIVLVGHRFGGISITEYADDHPDRLDRLVYLAAYIPRTGESLDSLSREDVDTHFSEDNFLISEDYATASVLASDRTDLFCNDCDDDQVAAMVAGFHDEPLAPLGTPAELSGAYLDVDKVYVRTLRDHAMSPAMQTLTLSRQEVALVLELDTGHSPFLTDPAGVAEALTRTP
jgi:pimeloyl-ACP methyl ester carboxylesterase